MKTQADAIERYLATRAHLDRPLHGKVPDHLEIVIVIPVLAEREHLPITLETIAANTPDALRSALVICVVNNRTPAHARESDIADNRATLTWLAQRRWASSLNVAYIDASSAGQELAERQGVGTARKIGMDRAVALLGNPTGIVASLDADTRVDARYLDAIRGHFASGASAAVVSYEHGLDGDVTRRHAVVSYELHLRYHELGLAFARSPYAFHTIGSAMACTAGAYVRAGGMNQRQAGEDFYFLQELAKTGRVTRVRGTTVYPSSRMSHRVPFGTGAYLARHLDGDAYTERLYDPTSYILLRTVIEHAEVSADCDSAVMIKTLGDALCESVRHHSIDSDSSRAVERVVAFLDQEQFAVAWDRIRRNSPGTQQTLQQFHRWFDALKTLRLVHALRDSALPNVTRAAAFGRLFTLAGIRGMPNGPIESPEACEAFLSALRAQYDAILLQLEAPK